MDVTLLLVAEAANISREGNLNLLGVFDGIAFRKLPEKLPPCVVVFQCQIPRAEFGIQKSVSVILEDHDGTKLWESEGLISVEQDSPDTSARIGVVIDCEDVTITSANTHQFRIMINGDTKKHSSLDIILKDAESE